jgi:hypothetical protein
MRIAPRQLKVLFAALIVGSVSWAAWTVAASSTATPRDYYVSPSGNDNAAGTNAAPFATLQHALNVAEPGTTITLEPGVYVGSVHTVTDGTQSAPISIVGADGAAAEHPTVLYGTGHVLDVNNSWYHLSGFEIDGQQALEAKTYYPADPGVVTTFKTQNRGLIADDELVYVGEKTFGVQGISLDNMFLQGGGHECVRIRNDASQISIDQSVIQYCGLAADSSDPQDPYHDGQGVEIGTSPKSTDVTNHNDDTTHGITVTNDVINTYGAECVDIEENAHDNVVSGDVCADNVESSAERGSNLDVRGYNNSVMDNTLTWSEGVNINLAVDSSSDPQTGNVVEGNLLQSAGVGQTTNTNIYDAVTGALICDNSLDGTTVGVSQSTASGPCPSGGSSPTTTTTTTTEPPTTTTEPPTTTTTTEPPTTTTTTTTGGNGGSELPAQILDLSNWKVTLPINSDGVPDGNDDAVEVGQPQLAGFSDSYFKSDVAGDGVTFIAPIDGSTTSGSYYPRSELREMTDNGTEEASWSTTSGTNTMTLNESVDVIPAVKQQVVFAQIHDSSGEIFLAEANYSPSKGYWLDINHEGTEWGSDLVDNYVLGTPFTLTVTASGGYIDVSYNGVQKVEEANSSSGDYFKAGAYTQSNECTEASQSSDCSSGKVDDHSFGEVTIYAINVTHTS